ncbi:hypothetical protein D9758_003677 [Tetrapyrgos nigripes]|uniref:HTH APSES-type domain-containing protein n=1 Tax=Tetrapyrgos nigripes TaxID=182062 RepID=A0A8H5LS33_9AGAR|nr:hypothetical protein D9758_003677 [Tetrapyrgos nigripes]
MAPRPPLPAQSANPHLQSTLDSGVLPLVKYQILNCRGQDILVGRMKIETPTVYTFRSPSGLPLTDPSILLLSRQPNGHAFILRRYDTKAVSLSSMFRAAFPTSTEAEEHAEVQWVKETYDLSGTNGNSKETHIVRLSGTWVNPSLALELGKAYKLGALISAVVEANPDPDANYRRSGKSAAGANGTVPTTKPPSTTATKSSIKAESPTAPNPPKRRKESSPAPAIVSESSTTTDMKVEVKKEKVAPTPLRRSNRTTKSPGPGKPKSSSSASSLSPVASRTTKRTVRREVKEEVKEEVTPSDETVVDDEDETVNYVAGEELREQDIAEQKVLIENLKAQRDAARKEDDEEKVTSKRARQDVEEEEQLKFDFKEPEIGERAIATNRRVPGYLERLPPERQGLAIGVAAFVFGVGAMFIPTFFS